MDNKTSKWKPETSPTMQAASNNANRTMSEVKLARINDLKESAVKVEEALSILITIPNGNDDLTDAIRSLGSFHAILAREAHKAQMGV